MKEWSAENTQQPFPQFSQPLKNFKENLKIQSEDTRWFVKQGQSQSVSAPLRSVSIEENEER